VETVCEPFLLRSGFLARTPRGRIATGKAYAHLGLSVPASGDQLALTDPQDAPG
jgi:Holliday junction DNA helicase RuvB